MNRLKFWLPVILVFCGAIVLYWYGSRTPKPDTVPPAVEHTALSFDDSGMAQSQDSVQASTIPASSVVASATPDSNSEYAEITESPEQAFYQKQLESLKEQLAALERTEESSQLIKQGDALLAQLEQMAGADLQVGPSEISEVEKSLQNQILKLEQRIQSIN
ncbi:hypothetical protein M3P05_12510 [Sansalvadorimonas sp. 2012CJ34-2]|uniref:Uncharacterized protein n=1 Tax=Parendozoicomonas callyspongiae TaxID=2942213 RepID=A0ABT0PIA3_9GAMM|nr:hypothetical protein [Sansalvadorimonas sp. 2012CJ34-2]MCL6270746.1 hypothetical protein [Sansalvadorimonas sp. 2012CJ34-2]